MKINKRVEKLARVLLVYIAIIIITLNVFAINAYADEDVLSQIKDTLKKYYIGKIPESVSNATTMEEIFKFLGDPYTQYLTKGEFNDFLNEVDMKFTGIGVNLEKVQTYIKVASVFPNSPAMEAGIKAGDIISEVNGQIIMNVPYSDARALINGEEGIVIDLKIIRNEKILDFSLIPRKISYPTVFGQIVDEHIGYIHIASFGSITGDEFGEKLKELNEKNVDSYVIDLRNNHGGYLYPVLDIAGYFIGNTVSLTVEDNVDGRFSLKAHNHGDIIRRPVIFLANEFTASSSEVLLAAIRDYNRGFIVGENTYGKGVAQTMFTLSDGSVLKTSTLKFFSPTGKEINSSGITPDLKINMVDPLYAAELLLGNNKNISRGDIYTRVKFFNNTFDINISKIKDKNYWEAYRTILNKTSYYSVLNNKEILVSNKAKEAIPQVNFVEIPKTQYLAGDRVSFKLAAPNFNNRIQYRAMLWDEEANTYIDLWSTKDGYYNKWQPKGSEVFTIGFPISKPGNYRIKLYAKRAGVLVSKTIFREIGCDCYLGEIPFVVLPT